MRKSRFTESQIVAILKQGEAGVPIAEIVRQHSISKATYFQWRSKYAGASVDELKRLKELEAENLRRPSLEPQTCAPGLLRAATQLAAAGEAPCPGAPHQPLMAPARLNETWALDFMTDALYDGRRFRTFNVTDEGNREALAIEIGTSIPSAQVIRVLDDLIRLYGRPSRVRVDNGPELTAEAFVEWCTAHRIAIGYIQPGKPFPASTTGQRWRYNSFSSLRYTVDDAPAVVPAGCLAGGRERNRRKQLSNSTANDRDVHRPHTVAQPPDAALGYDRRPEGETPAVVGLRDKRPFPHNGRHLGALASRDHDISGGEGRVRDHGRGGEIDQRAEQHGASNEYAEERSHQGPHNRVPKGGPARCRRGGCQSHLASIPKGGTRRVAHIP